MLFFLQKKSNSLIHQFESSYFMLQVFKDLFVHAAEIMTG